VAHTLEREAILLASADIYLEVPHCFATFLFNKML